jgi:eukaryotic-like serine/threonine-protein kinase
MARFWSRGRPAAATRTTEEHVETVPPPRPRPFWPWLLLLLLLVLGALAASWYFANRNDTVEAKTVPNVVGLQRDEADRRLKDDGFEVEPKNVISPKPAGEVQAQRPSPGTSYGEGGIVVISVARSAQRVTVPNVTGVATAAAMARLRAAGLRGRAQTVASRRPKGQVLRQVPVAGTEVPKDSPVVLIVSAGQQLVDVPEVVGMSAEAATTQLTDAGFRTRVKQVTASEPEGTVISQKPGGGSRAPRGQVVQINVSRGETETTTTVVTTTTGPSQGTVPDTVGQDEQSATFTLEDAGFRVRVQDRAVTDSSQDGIVIQQTPRGGTRRTGTTVTIVVGRLR